MTTEQKLFYRLLKPGEWILTVKLIKMPGYSERARMWCLKKGLLVDEFFQDRHYTYRKSADMMMAQGMRKTFIHPPITCIHDGNVLDHIEGKGYICPECKETQLLPNLQ